MTRTRIIIWLSGLALVFALAVLRIADPFPVQALRNIGFDFLQRAYPRPAADLPVRVVDIDERSLAAEGQWPWARTRLADLTRRLHEMGAAVVAYDVLFSEPDRLAPDADETGANAYDRAFAEALAAGPSVLGYATSNQNPAPPPASKFGTAISGNNPTEALPAPPGAVSPLSILSGAATGVGSISLDPSGSIGVVRRVPLLFASGDSVQTSLAIEALRVAQGVGTIILNGEIDGGSFLESIRVGAFEVPTTPTGGLWLRYRPVGSDLYVSAADILSDDYKEHAGRIAGQIVFVGTSAAGLLDIRATPLGTDMPGVAVHVQTVEQILTSVYLHRADWLSALELLGFVFTGLILVAAIPLLPPIGGLVLGGMFAAATGGFAAYAFENLNILVDPTFVMFGGAIVYLAMTILQLFIADAGKRQIRRAFGHFVSPDLLKSIEESSDGLKLGGEVRDLTIMFVDIRGFTSLSERSTPEGLVHLLNRLFGTLGAAVTGTSGTIDKFIGDSIMAFWNAPVDVPGHPGRACEAALQMRTRLAAFNAEQEAAGEPAIAIGIGIASGEALVGNLGLEDRFDYSCIGDTVNLSSRVESASKEVGFDILVSEATCAAAPDNAYLTAGAVSLKGKSAPQHLFLLVGGPEMAEAEWLKAMDNELRELAIAWRDGETGYDQLQALAEHAARAPVDFGRFLENLPTRRESILLGLAGSVHPEAQTGNIV